MARGGRHRLAAVRRRIAERAGRSSRAVGRRVAIAPWITISVVAVVLLGGLSFGYAWLSRSVCQGSPQTITVVAAPDQFKTLSGLAQEWQQTGPKLGDRCIGATVEQKNPATVASTLSADWDPRENGPQPDVWVPDSRAWLTVAAGRAEAVPLIPDKTESLASTPVVLAMPKKMAEAFGWPQASVSWSDLTSRLGNGIEWTKVLGQPSEWGKVKIGMANPVESTPSLHALLATVDMNNDQKLSADEIATVPSLSASLSLYVADTGVIFDGLNDASVEDANLGLQYVSVFPALERDISVYNAGGPKVPLAAIYPAGGTFDADYPYTVLKAPWVNDQKEKIAAEFLKFLRGDTGREAFGNAGFRDADRSTTYAPNLNAERGFPPELASKNLTVPAAAEVTETLSRWVQNRKPPT